ncbi:1-aminocyclopropane-1-carboxylate deaminase/D-cysteine desulfhydrase [Streptomyces sp. WP-1]|uniref:1-aminocyclopropane-1-carboxylate deaminase/D-cysteine desulfhydrase n=1 Tax=Streptomyces sp. WP-1 TaxID=3041497 RepID=UPI00264973E0|nr:pyridoxal-phosphate dependent enzyme [Streptomyces sp. WP-1]WKE69191.1 pyridoxal-phosphate dependent enzyme [Streptomyces sp. WP-1]
MSPLDALPRLPLVNAPTPLQPAARLSAVLGTEVWFKRDDLTGVGLGGNKVRALEYLIADALRDGCDSLVTGAGPQSNWATLAAVTASRHGLEPHLVYYGPPVAPVGNHALAELVGADIRFTGSTERTSVDAGIETLTRDLRARGRRPYALPRGGATPLGSIGYLRASGELADQFDEAGLKPESVWLATGSCGTQAGLVAGARMWGTSYRVTGVSVSRPVTECAARVTELADQAGRLAGLTDTGADDVEILDGLAGSGYGRPSAAGTEAARLVARTEGVFLDPVFGAKAMAVLVDRARAGRQRGPVVFLVSGGAPTLFGSPGTSLPPTPSDSPERRP